MKLLILLQCCVLFCKLAAGHEGEGYLEALGMENGKIADNQITASSERFNYKAVQARLRYKNKEGRPFGWQPKDSRRTEWLQVDLLDNYIVTGVATQGCLPVNPKLKLVFSVTKYQLEYSNDGKVFSTNNELYEGNKDASTVKYHTLETPIKARYIRFQPKSWKNKICMRVELYGNITEACDSSPCLNGGTCIQEESGEEYICKCTSGWIGDNCELDFTDQAKKVEKIEKEIANLKAELAKKGKPSGFAMLDSNGSLPHNLLDAGYDKYSAYDLAWQSLHMAAAAACRGSTASGGSGCCANQVMTRNRADKKTCDWICAQTAFRNCDAEVSIYGKKGKATKNGMIVGAFYNYPCSHSTWGGSEVSSSDETVMNYGGSYFSFCCCRK